MNWISATFSPQHPGSAKFLLKESEFGHEESSKTLSMLWLESKPCGKSHSSESQS